MSRIKNHMAEYNDKFCSTSSAWAVMPATLWRVDADVQAGEPARPENLRFSEVASRACPASRIVRRFEHRTCRADAVAESADEHCSKFRSSWLATEQVAQSSRWKV